MMKLIYTTAVLFFASLSQAQTVKVIDTFDELEAYAFDRTNTDSTYVINFWATWCGPCVKELPYFEQLAAKYEGKPFKQILVTLDSKRQVESRVVPFLKEKGIKSEVVLLADTKPNRWIDRVDPSWSGAIPITVIYKRGKREFYEVEFHSLAELETEFLKVYDN